MADLQFSDFDIAMLRGTSYKQSKVATASARIRMGFLRKVYGILGSQLLFTTVFGILCIKFEPLRIFMRTNAWWLIILSSIALIVLAIAAVIKRWEHPTNMIILACLTLSVSVSVGTAVTSFDAGIVLEVFIITTVVTAVLSFYNLQCKREISGKEQCFLVFGTVCTMIPVQLYIYETPIILLVCSSIITVLYSLFLIFDMNMIMERVHPEEYIEATLLLYLDIMNIFMGNLRTRSTSN